MAQLLTQKEFAEQLGVSTAYISSLVKQGKLPLENGRLSTKSLISMQCDILRHYNNLGTLLIYLDDSIDDSVLCNLYLDYCKENLNQEPANIGSPAKYITNILAGGEYSDFEEYNNEVSLALSTNILTNFVKDYLTVAKRYFLSLIINEYNISELAAKILYAYVLYGKFPKYLSEEESQGYFETYKSDLVSIDNYMTNVIVDLVWKYKLLDDPNVSKLDINKHSLVNRNDITSDFISLKGDFITKLSHYLCKNIDKNTPNAGKILTKMNMQNAKKDIKDNLKDGYFSCYSISNVSQIIGLITEDYYKHIIVIGDSDTFCKRLGDDCRVVLTAIKTLKIDVKFIDSFN